LSDLSSSSFLELLTDEVTKTTIETDSAPRVLFQPAAICETLTVLIGYAKSQGYEPAAVLRELALPPVRRNFMFSGVLRTAKTVESLNLPDNHTVGLPEQYDQILAALATAVRGDILSYFHRNALPAYAPGSRLTDYFAPALALLVRDCRPPPEILSLAKLSDAKVDGPILRDPDLTPAELESLYGLPKDAIPKVPSPQASPRSDATKENTEESGPTGSAESGNESDEVEDYIPPSDPLIVSGPRNRVPVELFSPPVPTKTRRKGAQANTKAATKAKKNKSKSSAKEPAAVVDLSVIGDTDPLIPPDLNVSFSPMTQNSAVERTDSCRVKVSCSTLQKALVRLLDTSPIYHPLDLKKFLQNCFGGGPKDITTQGTLSTWAQEALKLSTHLQDDLMVQHVIDTLCNPGSSIPPFVLSLFKTLVGTNCAAGPLYDHMAENKLSDVIQRYLPQVNNVFCLNSMHSIGRLSPALLLAVHEAETTNLRDFPTAAKKLLRLHAFSNDDAAFLRDAQLQPTPIIGSDRLTMILLTQVTPEESAIILGNDDSNLPAAASNRSLVGITAAFNNISILLMDDTTTLDSLSESDVIAFGLSIAHNSSVADLALLRLIRGVLRRYIVLTESHPDFLPYLATYLAYFAWSPKRKTQAAALPRHILFRVCNILRAHAKLLPEIKVLASDDMAFGSEWDNAALHAQFCPFPDVQTTTKLHILSSGSAETSHFYPDGNWNPNLPPFLFEKDSPPVELNLIFQLVCQDVDRNYEFLPAATVKPSTLKDPPPASLFSSFESLEIEEDASVWGFDKLSREGPQRVKTCHYMQAANSDIMRPFNTEYVGKLPLIFANPTTAGKMNAFNGTYSNPFGCFRDCYAYLGLLPDSFEGHLRALTDRIQNPPSGKPMHNADIAVAQQQILSKHLTELCYVLRATMCSLSAFDSNNHLHTAATGQSARALVDKDINRVESRISRLSHSLGTRLSFLEHQAGNRLAALEAMITDQEALRQEQHHLDPQLLAQRIETHPHSHTTRYAAAQEPSAADKYCKDGKNHITPTSVLFPRDRVNNLRKEALRLAAFSKNRSPSLQNNDDGLRTLKEGRLPPIEGFKNPDCQKFFRGPRKVARKGAGGPAPTVAGSRTRKRGNSDLDSNSSKRRQGN
jgi:hypothetical protein